MDELKTLALAVAMTLWSLPAAFSQTADLPFRITEIRRGDKAFCEVVIESAGNDAPVEGYVLVVGVNAGHSIKQIREGIVKDAAAKGAELCKVVSGKLSHDAAGATAVWEMVGLRDKPEGTCRVELPDDADLKKPIRVKAQLIALSGGKWIEKSKLLEKTLKP
jgi:hypothetical protein